MNTPNDANLEQFISSLPIPVVLCTSQSGEIITRNRRFLDTFNFTGDSFIHFLSQDKQNQKLVDLLKTKTKWSMQGEIPEEFQVQLNTKDSQDQQFVLSVSAHGAEKSMLLITLRELEGQRLAKQREVQYRAIFDNANDAIFIMDADTFIDCNKKTEEIFGCTREQIIGKSPHLFSPEYQPNGQPSDELSNKNINKVLEGEPQFFQWVHKRYDNTTFHAEVSLNRIELEGRAHIQAIVRDISIRHKAQEELKYENFFVKSLMDNTNDSIYFKDRFSRFIRVNRAVVLKFGAKSPEEIIGKQDADFFTEEYAQRTRNIERQIMEEGAVFEAVEEREVWSDGSVTYASSSKMPLLSNEGEVIGIIGVSRDITKQKNIELALLERDSALRILADNLPTGMVFQIEFSPDGKERAVKYVSSNVERTHGISIEEAMEHPDSIYNLIIEEDRDYFFEKEWEAFKNLIPFKVEVRLKLSNGALKWFYISSAPRILSNGNVIWDGIQMDITDKKEADEALRKSEERLRYVFDATNDAVWDWNLETNEVFLSDRYFTMLGHEAGDSIKLVKNWKSLLHPDDLKKSLEQLDLYISGKIDAYDVEYRLQTKEGKWLWMHDRGKVVERSAEGVPLRMVGVNMDINQRKIVEGELRERELSLTSLSNNLPFGLFFQMDFGKDGKQRDFKYVSGSVERIHGVTAEQVYKDHTLLYRKVIPEDIEKFAQLEKEAFEQMKPFKAEVRFREESGSIRWVAINSAPRKMANGHVIMDGVEMDITDRKEMEEALRKSEERLRYVFDATNDGFWDWNVKEDEVFFSDIAYSMLGYERGGFPSTLKGWASLIHPDERDETVRRIKDYVRGKICEYISEYRLKKKDGSWMWIRARGKIVEVDEQGNPTRLVGTHMDISQQKEMEEELRDSALFLQTVLDTIPVKVLWKDLDHRYLGCNLAVAQDLGLTNPAEIVGKTNLDFNLHEQAFLLSEDDRAIIAEGNPIYNHEKLFYTPDGKPHWVRISKVPLKTAKGEVIGILGAYDEITDTVIARNSIELERAYFEQLFESSPEGIVLVDNSGMVVRCNHEFERMFQYKEEEIIGQAIDLFIVPDSREDEGRRINWLLDKGELVQVETIRKRKDGTLMDVSFLGRPISFKGGNIAMYGIFRDITERKQVELDLAYKTQEIEAQNEEYRLINEELFEAKLKAEESDKLKSAFLANMSHEIRTPMNGILGFSRLLTKPDVPKSEVNQYVEIIQTCGNQLLCIINDLIDISKIESNQVKIIFLRTHVNQVLNEQFMIFKEKAQQQGIELSYMTDLEDDKSIVLTDTARLNQILTNLIGNAIKFTKEGHVRFGYRFRSTELEFFVNDTGVGIMPDKSGRIFERFMQVETDIAHQVGGTGLGLAISKAYVNKLGGHIWFDSVYGEGSTFYFTIPYKQSESLETEPDIKADDAIITNEIAKQATILVAEDDDANFLVLREMLSDYDLNILRAHNGKEAISIVEDTPQIELIFMDVKMPVMNGLDATKEIKKIRPDLTVIAQTAYAFSSDRDKALEAGCDDYISKPIKSTKLIDLMKKHLKK